MRELQWEKDDDLHGLFTDLLDEAAGLIDRGAIGDDALEPTSSDETSPQPVILSIGDETEDERSL